MCGIAGFISLSGEPADHLRVAGMVATLRHRGPDDAGTFAHGPAALGVARLSVIDLAGGHQPISIDGGAITVVQNGEIYNYVELRDELVRAGRRLATASDTEVIAHLYARHGLDAFARMRGMFAVAIWDETRQQLVLARDRVGKKPLYYARRAGELLFGSEIKAILAVLDRAPDIHAPALLEFLTFGYVAGQPSIFEGVRRLTPGSTLVVRPNDPHVVEHPYWTWPEPGRAGLSEDEAVEQLRSELSEAVRIRLRADVPLGLFLSGGMDSATVLALAARHSSQPVKTFAIGFGDPEYDELAEARETAASFGAEHHEEVVTPDTVRDAATLAHFYDEPFADASAIPTFHVAALARRSVTVCLTGDGGDELFGGYTPYRDALRRVGPPGIAAFRAILGAGARYVPVHARGKGRLSTASMGPEAWFVWRRTVFPDYLLNAVADPSVLAAGCELPEREAVEQLRHDNGPLLGRLQRWDQRHYLPGDILVKVDRATMAHSLEARCPLLDHRVVELAASVAPQHHGDAASTKRLFRRVIVDWVPASVLARPKRGFGVPLRRWFHEGLIGWAREILTDPRTAQRGWTRSAQVNALLRQHEQGSRDHAKRIWALVCLELWARRHVDRTLATGERACA